MIPENGAESSHRVCPLIADDGNRRLLVDWLDDHPSYETVDPDQDIETAECDVCIIDKEGFQEHLDALRAKKSAAAPVLLPYLLLLPEGDSGIIDTDEGQLADNVVTEAIDEIVTLPIQQAELHWRLTALLRLREQSVTLHSRERELERQVDLFEKAQDIANVGAWEYDIEADKSWLTDEVYRIHGLTQDSELTVEASIEYYHPDDRSVIEDAFEAAIQAGEPYDVEVRFIDGADNHRWVRTRGEPQYEESELTRIRGTIQDITERKERERDLRRIKQAVESSAAAVYITDTEGTIEYANPAFEEITGFTQQEILGKTPYVLDSGEMSEEYFEKLWTTILSGEVWEEEIVNRRKDGELYRATQTIAPVIEDGEIQAFVAVQNDITERKEREETLERRTHAIDEAPVGITISDPAREDNPLIYANDAFVELTGYSREEVLGRNCRFLQGERTDPDAVDRIRSAIDAKEPVSIELRNYRKDGTEFWNHLEIAPVRNSDGEVVNYIGFQQDVTGRKERQRQLEILDRVLRHNLRNEVGVIRSQAETIQHRTSGDLAASAEQIIGKTNALEALTEKERRITQLLQEDPSQTPIELGEVIDDLTSEIGSKYPDATLSVEQSDDVTVQASQLLPEAIHELVTNAIVHNVSEPDVAINVTHTDDAVRIAIADDGPRIPEAERNLSTSDAEPTPLYHGSGLGLWLVTLIVERSGGRLAFKENAPTGNIVEIELPH